MSIAINIITGINAATTSIVPSGNMKHVITPSEAQTFSIYSTDRIKDLAERYLGRWPNEAFIKAPTPNGDMYERHNWEPVYTNLTVHKAFVKGIDTKSVIVDKKILTNSSNHKATFNAGISCQVMNTVQSNWLQTNTFSFTQAINYGISFHGIGVGGVSTFNFQKAFAEGGFVSNAVTIGSTTGVTVELKPGESVTAELIANQGTMSIQVEYAAYLSGNAAFFYFPKFRGYNDWTAPIENLLNHSGISNKRIITENLDVGYYTNSSVVIRDTNGGIKNVFHFPSNLAENTDHLNSFTNEIRNDI